MRGPFPKPVPPPGLQARLRAWVRRLSLPASWFPQAPLAVAVGLLGISTLLPVLGRLVHWSSYLSTLAGMSSLRASAAALAFGGVPQGVTGIVLMVMSVGLFFRSRLAWTVAVILLGAAAVIALRHSGPPATLVLFDLLVLGLLLLAHRVFSQSSLAAGTLFAVVSIILLFGYAVFGTYLMGAEFAPPVRTLPTAFYFTVVTMSTVGYGDIIPKTDDARLFVSSLIVLGIAVFTTSVSAVIVPIVNRRLQRILLGEKRRMARTSHHVLAGDTPLAHNSYRELRARGAQVTVILTHQPEGEWLDRDDLIVGDATDPEVLRKADAAQALAVLALRADDRENAFIVLAAKEVAPGVRTVAAVKDARNLGRVRRVGPDMIVAPEILGGELLAMALSGEELDGDALLQKMFNQTE